jgi:hypothetical protein
LWFLLEQKSYWRVFYPFISNVVTQIILFQLKRAVDLLISKTLRYHIIPLKLYLSKTSDEALLVEFYVGWYCVRPRIAGGKVSIEGMSDVLFSTWISLISLPMTWVLIIFQIFFEAKSGSSLVDLMASRRVFLYSYPEQLAIEEVYNYYVCITRTRSAQQSHCVKVLVKKKLLLWSCCGKSLRIECLDVIRWLESVWYL